MKLEILIGLIVATCSWKKNRNLVSSFLAPLPITGPNYKNNEGKFFASKDEADATKKIQDCEDVKELSKFKVTPKEINDFSSQEIAHTVWAYAKFKKSSPKLFAAISFEAIKKLNTFKSQEIANTVWAYATLGHSSPKLFDALSYKAIEELDNFSPQDIANTVWAYAKADRLPPKLFDAISPVAMEKLGDFTSRDLDSIVEAYTKLGHSSPKLLDAIELEQKKRKE
eukprot:CAMPEP_0194142736 /NCGR_PEP_ID=MMETSP0152-20130528/11960_1 /TAXON_ID=1049557 /ORGANISM="Thalassiothrix antarctica, Strain L6-D1" /LENGTH=225 /DNA_ID=CAMNT_0038841813 /DNA_START=18 /DNA_END=695 /DNA_ORIENTATION=-